MASNTGSNTKTMTVSRKRQRSTRQIPQQERWLRSSTKIADIGVDCLEHVFTYFDLNNLISVAQVSHQFRLAANYVFISKYSKKRIAIRTTYTYLRTNYDITDGQLVVRDPKTCFKVLRCFGRNIFDINFKEATDLDCERNRQFYAIVIPYINIYCAVKRIVIDAVNLGFDMMCANPFSLAETVELHIGVFDILSLNRLFPKMQSLNVQWYFPRDREVIKAEHYPDLQRLQLYFANFSYSAVRFFKNVLQLNKQIRSLEIRTERSLYYLMETIRLPNVEDFNFHDFGRQPPIPRKIPFNFDKLKVLTLKRMDGHYLNNYHNFIKRHKSVEKLIIDYAGLGIFEDLENGFLSKSKSLKSLASLKEISLEVCYQFPIDYVVKYMLDFETLKYFSFFCLSTENDIKKCCGNDWKVIHLDLSEILRLLGPKLPFIKLIRNI